MHPFTYLAIVALSTVSTAAFSPIHPTRSFIGSAHPQTRTWMANNDHETFPVTKSLLHQCSTAFATSLLCAAVWHATIAPVAAESSRLVGQIAGSGLIFKDTLEIESFEDPKIRGVTLYISTFQRPLNERLSSAKNFFSDPANSSVACAKTSPVVQVADNINKSTGGEEVFQENKSLLFKSLKVQRIFDAERNTVVYVSFNTRLDKNDDSNKSRFANSLCAVNLDDQVTTAAPSKATTAPEAVKVATGVSAEPAEPVAQFVSAVATEPVLIAE